MFVSYLVVVQLVEAYSKVLDSGRNRSACTQILKFKFDSVCRSKASIESALAYEE